MASWFISICLLGDTLASHIIRQSSYKLDNKIKIVKSLWYLF